MPEYLSPPDPLEHSDSREYGFQQFSLNGNYSMARVRKPKGAECWEEIEVTVLLNFWSIHLSELLVQIENLTTELNENGVDPSDARIVSNEDDDHACSHYASYWRPVTTAEKSALIEAVNEARARGERQKEATDRALLQRILREHPDWFETSQ